MWFFLLLKPIKCYDIIDDFLIIGASDTKK